MAKKKPWLDLRALIQALAAFVLIAIVSTFGTCINKTVTDTKAKIDSHSSAIEKIPEIRTQIETNASSATTALKVLSDNLDKAKSEVNANVERVSQKVDDKTKGIVTWDLFNQKLDKTNEKVDKLSTDNAEIKGQLNSQRVYQPAPTASPPR